MNRIETIGKMLLWLVPFLIGGVLGFGAGMDRRFIDEPICRYILDVPPLPPVPGRMRP
jgi:hypothetical protein